MGAQAARALPTGSECDSKASVLKPGDPGDWEEPTYPGPAEAAFLPPGKAESQALWVWLRGWGTGRNGGELSRHPLLRCTGLHCKIVQVNHKTLQTGPVPEATAGLLRAGDLQGEPGSVRPAAGRWWLNF